MKRGLVAGVLSALFTPIVYLPVCDLVFGCGCAWLFAGGAAHCNMHNALPPHCPACTGAGTMLALGAATFAACFAAVSLMLFLLGRRAPRPE